MPVQRILLFSQNKNASSFQSQHINELDTSRRTLCSYQIILQKGRKEGGVFARNLGLTRPVQTEIFNPTRP